MILDWIPPTRTKLTFFGGQKEKLKENHQKRFSRSRTRESHALPHLAPGKVFPTVMKNHQEKHLFLTVSNCWLSYTFADGFVEILKYFKCCTE